MDHRCGPHDACDFCARNSTETVIARSEVQSDEIFCSPLLDVSRDLFFLKNRIVLKVPKDFRVLRVYRDQHFRLYSVDVSRISS